MNYSDFETGDIILFFGSWWKSPLSCLIEFFTLSKYSHIGIVIKNPNFTPEPLNGLYLLESTGIEQPDSENKEPKFGVQLQPLKERLETYSGRIYYRKLNCDRNAIFYSRLTQAHSVVHNLPYDCGLDYIKAAFHLEVGNLQNKRTFFCSALVAFIYVSWGFLSKDTEWSLVRPVDLAERRKWNNCEVELPIEIRI